MVDQMQLFKTQVISNDPLMADKISKSTTFVDDEISTEDETSKKK